MVHVYDKMIKGFEAAFIDGNTAVELAYQPQFLSNNYMDGRKVLSSIEDELLNCNSFCISVAFITLSGIEPLLQTFKELERKGIPGRILTTDYLTFSQPKALRKLKELTNIDLRMYCTGGENDGFHTKGYIFQDSDVYRIIIGSSNMTSAALTINKEWNTKIVSTEQGAFAVQILHEFEELWNSSKTKSYADFIGSYETKYNAIKEQRRRAAKEENLSTAQFLLEPNSMQVEFIKNLHGLVEDGARRALLISATGTGKTYASAFGLRNESPNKILFIVHREQIARQALDSYKMVFGSVGSYGLLSGTKKDYDARFLFSTMNMMAKELPV